MRKDKQITTRLNPFTDPEKIYSVRKVLALIAQNILEKGIDLNKKQIYKNF